MRLNYRNEEANRERLFSACDTIGMSQAILAKFSKRFHWEIQM